MLYCYVENNQVLRGPTILPKAWGNISGFNNLSADRLKEFGWLPFRVIQLADDEKVMTGEVTEITETEVVRSFTYRDKTQDEKDADAARVWEGPRGKRNQLLQESDWTQLADAPLTDGDKAAWALYRQALRDITKQPDPDNLAWPQSPADGIKVAQL